VASGITARALDMFLTFALLALADLQQDSRAPANQQKLQLRSKLVDFRPKFYVEDSSALAARGG
jgi:hypothetical protein